MTEKNTPETPIDPNFELFTEFLAEKTVFGNMFSLTGFFAAILLNKRKDEINWQEIVLGNAADATLYKDAGQAQAIANEAHSFFSATHQLMDNQINFSSLFHEVEPLSEDWKDLIAMVAAGFMKGAQIGGYDLIDDSPGSEDIKIVSPLFVYMEDRFSEEDSEMKRAIEGMKEGGVLDQLYTEFDDVMNAIVDYFKQELLK